MTYELFVPQRERYGAPRCVLCDGKIMNGLSCTCAVDASWLYRASQGKIKTTMCRVRDLTDDCVGGTRLRQMEEVNVRDFHISTGALYLPATIDHVFDLVDTGRYAGHLNISYAAVVGHPQDAFAGAFRSNHDILLAGRGGTDSSVRVMDPGNDHFMDWPKSLLRSAAQELDLDGHGLTLAEEAGGGKCYAYMTPPDPVVARWWPFWKPTPPTSASFAVQFLPGTYSHYNRDGTKHGHFTTKMGFTAYGNRRFRVGTRLFGQLLEGPMTGTRHVIVDVHSGANYWSK